MRRRILVSPAAAAVAGISYPPALGADVARFASPRNGSDPADAPGMAGPHVRPASVLPDQAQPLQRSQLMAAFSLGTEIIQLRQIVRRTDLGPELGRGARGSGGKAAPRSRSTASTGSMMCSPLVRAPPLYGRVAASLRYRTRLPNMPLTSAREPPCEVQRNRSVRGLCRADVVDDDSRLGGDDRPAAGSPPASACCATSGTRLCSCSRSI